MSGIEHEIELIYHNLRDNSNAIEEINRRLDELEGDKKAVD